jgi:hypothetical protein
MKGELVEAKVRILGELGSGSKIDGNIEKENFELEISLNY